MWQWKKVVAVLLAGVLLLGGLAVPPKAVQAKARKVQITKKVTVKVGKTAKIKLKNNKQKVKWKVTKGKNVVRLTKKKTTSVTVKALKKGTATVVGIVGKKRYTCKVKVKGRRASVTKKPTAAERPAETNPSKPTPLKSTYNNIDYAIPYQTSEIGTVYNGNDYFTMMGKKYRYGFCGEPCYNSWAQYNLAGKYDMMSYTIGHVDNTAFEDAAFILELDGVEVEKINLTGDMTTITRTVDVKNVSNMKISIRDAAHVTSYYGVANIVFDNSIKLLKEDTSSTNILKNGVTYAIPYQTGDVGDVYKGDDCFTMMGEKFYYGFCGEPCYNSHAQINLEGKYTKLSYKIGHVDQTADEDATLILELDGKVVEQINLSGDMATLSKTLDVTGGINLKIQIRDAAHVTSWYGMANMTLK